MKNILLILLVLPLGFISCDKLREDPRTVISSSKINNGKIELTAQIVKGRKQVSESGFCFGTSSKPTADLNTNITTNTVACNLDGDKFSASISNILFQSFTGYYFRPYVTISSGEIFYGKEVYLEDIQGPLVMPTCSFADNYINVGTSSSPETFYGANVYTGNEYQINAYSNSVNMFIKFRYKPKNGVYTTENYLYDDNSRVEIYFYKGSGPWSVLPGSKVYVNEVEKDKFEITMCNLPWKLGSSTLYINSKLIVE